MFWAPGKARLNAGPILSIGWVIDFRKIIVNHIERTTVSVPFPKQALYSIWVTLEVLHCVETLRELPIPSNVRRNWRERICRGSSSVSKYVTSATVCMYVCIYVCMTSFTLTPRKIESDMQATTTIYNHVRTGRIYHFLDELGASPRPDVA
jgi:hypothetical protein